MRRGAATSHPCLSEAANPAQNVSSGLGSCGAGGGAGRPLQETLGPGAIALWDMSAACPDSVQGHSLGGARRWQAP